MPAAPHPKTAVVNMTPKQAQKLLEANTHNRPLSRTRVDYLVAAIQAGEWVLTHQGVGVATDGTLLDGQHRLTAIVKAGEAVPILLTTGLEPEAFAVIDTGFARNGRDVLTMAGVPYAQRIPPVVRLLSFYRSENRDRPMDFVPRMTNAAVLAAAQAEPLLVTMAPYAERAAVSMGTRGMISGLMAAFVAIAQDAPELESTRQEFMDRLANPVMLSQDSPVLSLRRWITVTVVSLPSRQRSQIVMYGTIRAWNAFVEGRPLSRISGQRWARDGAPVISTGPKEEDEVDGDTVATQPRGIE